MLQYTTTFPADVPAFFQRCFNIGPPSATLAQHRTNTGITSVFHDRVYHAIDTSPQCCTNVGPPSTTMARHWSNIGWMSGVCWEAIDTDDESGAFKGGRLAPATARGRNLSDGALNSLIFYLVCLPLCSPSKHNTLTRCLFNVGPASQTLDQH